MCFQEMVQYNAQFGHFFSNLKDCCNSPKKVVYCGEDEIDASLDGVFKVDFLIEFTN